MKSIEEIIGEVTLIGQTPDLIIRAKIPDRIFDEMKGWVEPCRAIKDDEYAALLYHNNAGTNHNSYQIGIPRRLMDNSLSFGYIIRFGELFLTIANLAPKDKLQSGYRRMIHMRNHQGHFDGYDAWLNFTYKGDDNPVHSHAGHLSGIIYIKDEDKQPTHFPDINYTHHPEEGEILLFSSHVRHYVDVKQTESERITSSFNLDAVFYQ